MPPFTNGVDLLSGFALENLNPNDPAACPGAEDLDQINVVAKVRECHPHLDTQLSDCTPCLTDFLKIDECRADIELEGITEAATGAMADLLETSHRLHERSTQALENLDTMSMSQWKAKPSSTLERGSSYESNTSLTNNWATARKDEEDLGSFLSRPVSPPSEDQCSVGRKRSLSSVLESEVSDQRGHARSKTSSDCKLRAVDEKETKCHRGPTPARNGHIKIQKIGRLSAPKVNKGLLSLSLPTVPSPQRSESFSSFGESDPDVNDRGSDACNPFAFNKLRRSTSNVHPASYNDVAESDVLNGTTVTSISLQDNGGLPSRERNHVSCSVEDDDAAADTSTHSSTKPGEVEEFEEEEDNIDEPAVRLTLEVNLLPVTKTAPKQLQQEAKRSIHPALTGLDASIFNSQNLLMLGPDTGLEAHGLQLVHMLLKCADATAKNNVDLAASILGELYQGASLYGDSMQRVTAYFAEGLAARIVGKESPVYSTLMGQASKEELFVAFTTLYKVAPYLQFAHFTANQAILEAVEGHSMVHVIDLDILQGFQWPSLIQALASRPGGPPHLRITGIGKHGDMLKETARRLTNFAASFEVPFEFHSLVEENLENLTAEVLALRFGEVIAVNSVLQLHRLLNPASGEKMHKFMHTVCKQQLHPKVVTLVEQEANHNASSFLGRFMEALHYYAAVFDSLDASLPQQNEERVKIEQVYFAQQIKNIVACEGDDRVERHETVDQWQHRMEMAGFVQVPLSSHAISQAKLLLQFSPCEEYRLHERIGSVSLGWQERQLLTASSWSC